MGGSCMGSAGLCDADPARQSQQGAPAAQQAQVSLSEARVVCTYAPLPPPLPLPVHLLQMYLDSRRAGEFDAHPTNYPVWQYGAGGFGAIIMVSTSFEGDLVPERCKVRFRWDTGPETRLWTANLTVTDHGRIRFYLSSARGAAEIVLAGGVLDIGALPVAHNGDIELWMEASDYGAGADEALWRVNFAYSFVDANGVAHRQSAELRIAPWIMASDLDPTRKVFAVAGPPDAPPALPVPGVAAQPSFRQSLRNFVGAANAEFHAIAPRFLGLGRPEVRKPFVRDIMRCGYSQATHHAQFVFLRGLDANATYEIGLATLLAPARDGHLPRARWTHGPGAPTGQDGGGNLLVSPPQPGYPYGRIIHGDSAGYRCHAGHFFWRQMIQRPVLLNSSWLYVGHVDEYLSFVPDTREEAAAWPWKVLMLDPWLAYALAYAAWREPNAPNREALCLRAEACARDSRMANGNYADLLARCDVEFPGGIFAAPPPAPPLPAPPLPAPPVPAEPVQPLVLDEAAGYQASALPPADQEGRIVTGGADDDHYVSYDFGTFGPESDHADMFNIAAPLLFADRATLRAALGRTEVDFVSVPALLKREIGGLVTLTGDSVNLLQLRDGNSSRCLVAKPFGPVCSDAYLFEEHIRRALTRLGLAPTFLNDWRILHSDDGEIHCGTNQLPRLETMDTTPAPGAGARQWWLQAMPAAAAAPEEDPPDPVAPAAAPVVPLPQAPPLAEDVIPQAPAGIPDAPPLGPAGIPNAPPLGPAGIPNAPPLEPAGIPNAPPLEPAGIPNAPPLEPAGIPNAPPLEPAGVPNAPPAAA
jgi:hypothetical protein